MSPTYVHKIFLGLLFTYKMVLQLIALLALCTNDIKVKGLDDAKYVITTVYLTTINIVLVIMTFYLLKGYLNIYTSMITLLVFISTTTILGLVFIPKVIINQFGALLFSQMIALYNDPKGERVFDKYETPSFKSQQQHAQLKQTETDSTTMTIDSLKKRIQELENIIAVNNHQVDSEVRAT